MFEIKDINVFCFNKSYKYNVLVYDIILMKCFCIYNDINLYIVYFYMYFFLLFIQERCVELLEKGVVIFVSFLREKYQKEDNKIQN